MRHFLRTVIIGLIIFFGFSTGFGLQAQERLNAEDIAYKVFSRDDGDDSYSKIDMVLIDKKGRQRKRELDVYVKDFGMLSKTLIRFLSPADIEGTGFLSMENSEGDDTQYLYLPDLGRSRRIVSSQKYLRFVNTDFTYEDMQRRKPEKDNHRLLGEERLFGYACYVLEYTPKDSKTSQYSKIIQWIDKTSFIPIQAEFYNKKGQMFKRLVAKKIEKIDGIWTIMDTQMEDLLENHTTWMGVIEVRYNQGLGDDRFTVQSLEDY